MRFLQTLTFHILVAAINASMILSVPLSLRADTSTPSGVSSAPTSPTVTSSPVAIHESLGLTPGENITRATAERAYNSGRMAILSESFNPNNLNSAAERSRFYQELRSAAHIIRTSGGPSLVQETLRNLPEFPSNATNAERMHIRNVALFERMQPLLSEYQANILDVRSRAWEIWRDPASRAAYQAQQAGQYRVSGPRFLLQNVPSLARGQITLPGVGGTPTARVPSHIRLDTSMSSLMRDLASGSAKMTMTTAMIFFTMYAYSATKMRYEYLANPAALDEVVQKYGSMLMLFSMMGFGAGSAATARWNNYVHKLAQAMMPYIEGGKFATNMRTRDRFYRQSLGTQIRGMSVAGLGMGLLFSQIIFTGGKYLSSCMKIASDRPMSPRERDEATNWCDNFGEIFKQQILPSLLIMLPVIFSAQHIMLFAGTSFNALKRMRGISWAGASQSQALANSIGANRDMVRHWRMFRQMPMRTLMRKGVPKALIGRAVVRPAMRLLTAFGVGAIQIGAFLIIIEIGVAAGRYAWSHLKQGFSIQKARNNLRSALDKFYEDGMEIPQECEIRHVQEIEDPEVLEQVRDQYGLVETSIGQVMQDPYGNGYIVNECNDNANENDRWFYSLFQSYQTALSQHRQFLTSPVSTILTNWLEYFSNANNMHKASYHFYGDILGQINAKKQESEGAPLLRSQGNFDSDRAAMLSLFAEEKYPAFRTHPLFGVRPHDKIKTTVQEDERGRPAVPQWNGVFEEEHSHALWQLNAQKANLRHIANYVAQVIEATTNNLAPGIDHALREIHELISSDDLSEMANGLTRLSDHTRTFSLNHYMCEDPDMESTDMCIFRELQRQLSSPLYTAALMIDNRVEEGRVREEDRAELSQISTLLKSSISRDRNEAIERLIELFEFTAHETLATCLTSFDSNNCAAAEAILALEDSLPFSYRVRPEFGGYYNVHNPNNYRESGHGYLGLEHGPLPLGMGNRYLMEYDNNFQAAGVDFNWYPVGANATEMGSMGHYLMTNMLCGGDTMEHNDVSITSDNFLLIFPRRNVRFSPPKIPLTTDVDRGFIGSLLRHDSYEYCGRIRNANNPKAIWEKIYASPSSKEINGDRRYYQGLMDLLYHEAHPGVLGDNFEDWWDRVALNPIANQVESKTYAVNNFLFQKSVELLNDDYPFHNFLTVGEENNLTESTVEEMEFLFEVVFDRILEAPQIDFVPTSISDEMANATYVERKQYMDDYWYNLKLELKTGLRAISEGLKFSIPAAERAREDFFNGPWEKFWYLFQTYRGDEKQELLDSRESNDGRFKHPILTYKPYEANGAFELPLTLNDDGTGMQLVTEGNNQIVALWKNARVSKILLKRSINDLLEVVNLVYDPDDVLDDEIETVNTVPVEYAHNPELAEAMAEQDIPEGMGPEDFMEQFLGIVVGADEDVQGVLTITLDEHMVNILEELGFDPANPDTDTIAQMFTMISAEQSGADEDQLPPPEDN